MRERILDINEIRKQLSPSAQLAFMKVLSECNHWSAPAISPDFDCFWLGVFYKDISALCYYKHKIGYRECDEILEAVFNQYLDNYC